MRLKIQIELHAETDSDVITKDIYNMVSDQIKNMLYINENTISSGYCEFKDLKVRSLIKLGGS